jgi:beta-lactamase regulating signal transducer with metallopeptidase domain
MLREIFYWILNMSILASVIGILLYFLRFLKGFPKFGSYFLWIIVLIRLLCPFGMSSRYSLLNLINKASRQLFIKAVPVDAGAQRLSLTNTIQAASSYEPFTFKTNLLEGFFEAASVVWIVITAAAVLAMTVLYFLAKAELSHAVHLRDNIYISPMIGAPTVYGIRKPRIVIPPDVPEEQLEYILAHERIHIRRHDNIWRMAAILTACVHWFNPFIWLFLKTFLADTELACDAAAVKPMKEEERKNYARTLLAFANREKTVFSSGFGSSRVRVRIQNILTYKKLTLFSAACFAAMAIMIAFILLTNASAI